MFVCGRIIRGCACIIPACLEETMLDRGIVARGIDIIGFNFNFEDFDLPNV